VASAITIDRFIEKLERMRDDMQAGKLQSGEYDQQLARLIGELREQKLDADRGTITAALDRALQRGVITPAVKEHLERRLGLM
jgi:hypothetical protein